MAKTPPVLITDKEHPEGFAPSKTVRSTPKQAPDSIAKKIARREPKVSKRVWLQKDIDQMPEHLRPTQPQQRVSRGISMLEARTAIAGMIKVRDERAKKAIMERITKPTVNELALKRIGENRAKAAGEPAPVTTKEQEHGTTAKPEAPGQPGGQVGTGIPVAKQDTAENVAGRVRSRRTRKGASGVRGAK